MTSATYVDERNEKMKNSVVIKGNKYGIIVMLDDSLSFSELKEAVALKFKESSKFLGDSAMGITFEGKSLNDDEIRELLDIIAENSNLNIVCVMDTDKQREELFKTAVESVSEVVEETVQENIQTEDDASLYTPGSEGQFYRGTLRSGQVIECEGSIVILGDVNPGAKVVSSGNVVILGALKGTVYAGVTGDASAFVVALEMSPMQIRIGDYIARSSDNTGKIKSKKAKAETKIAFVENGNIYIEPLNKEVLNDIHFN